VPLAESGEVVDPGRGGLGAPAAVGEAGLGMPVPADRERDGGPGGLPAGPDLDPVQVALSSCVCKFGVTAILS
jgi:hypothetical protein